MILFRFSISRPLGKDNFSLPDFIQQRQAQQRQDQQAEINRKTPDTLMAKLSQKNIIGLDPTKTSIPQQDD